MVRPIVKVWDNGVPMEPDVWKQVDNIAAVPGVERIAIMPDAHIGNGACVGSAILTRSIVIPAAVGVDIGCGMIAAPLEVRRSELGPLADLRADIEAMIPVGRTNNGQRGDRGAWGTPPDDVVAVWRVALEREYRTMVKQYPDLKHDFAVNHLGTLGTGNHFLEVCIEVSPDGPLVAEAAQQATPAVAVSPDGPLVAEAAQQATSAVAADTPEPDPRVWLMLHSGSRGIGNRIGSYFTRRARAETQKRGLKLPDPELGYLERGTNLFDDYLRFAEWAQGYAWQSRLLMFTRALQALHLRADESRTVHCNHNYVAYEEHFGAMGWVTRKGAVNAADGVMGIIPGSMGARSYITRGKGNPEALRTSSHGAGRVMSRGVARRTISMQQHLQAMAGVEARTDADVLDESPAAYKPIDTVMAAQRDLTQPVVALKQIIVVKG